MITIYIPSFPHQQLPLENLGEPPCHTYGQLEPWKLRYNVVSDIKILHITKPLNRVALDLDDPSLYDGFSISNDLLELQINHQNDMYDMKKTRLKKSVGPCSQKLTWKLIFLSNNIEIPELFFRTTSCVHYDFHFIT